MALTLDIDPGLRDVALALGLAKSAGGSVTLNTAFFGAPGQYVRKAVSDDTQRAALLSALEHWLASSLPTLPGAADDAAGAQRVAYPLLDDDLPGQVYVVATVSGSGAAQSLQLSVAGAVAAANDGPRVQAELALLVAANGTLQPVAASAAHPLRIEASAPVSATGGPARLTATLRIVAPPDEAQSRFDIRLDGLPDGVPPIEFDLADGAPPLARIVTLVLDVLLAQIDPNAAPAALRAAAALPTLLGLLPGFPEFPFDKIARDPAAIRRWLAQVAVARTSAGDSALVAWFDALGRLMGAPARTGALPAGTEDDPALVPLFDGGPGLPALTLLAAVRAESNGGSPVLLLGLRLALAANAPFDAALNADALLIALPLLASTPPTLLERLDLRVDVPGSAATLLDPAETAGALGIRRLRAGLRYDGTPGASRVVPLLELIDVDLQVAGVSHHFDVLDLTHADALTGAAQSLLSDAIAAGLGAAAPLVDALRTLLGIGTTPGIDFALMATAPTRALAQYFRTLRQGADGWKPLVAAVGRLLGNTDDTVTGTGTRVDPWCAPIELLAAPAGSPLALEVAVWDDGDAATPRWTLALRGRADTALGLVPGSVQARATVALLQIDLPAAGNGSVHWLGDTRLGVAVAPRLLQADIDILSLVAKAVRAEASWQPGQPLRIGASLDGIALVANDGSLTQDDDSEDGTQPARIALGDLALPPTGFDATQPDLGLGLDPTALWNSVRWLLARASASWSGPQTRALLALVGLLDAPPSAQPGDGATLPTLALPVGGLPALLADPVGAVRAWLVDLLAGSPGITAAAGAAAVQALLEILSASLASPGQDGVVAGGGAPADPWTLPIGSAGPVPLALTLWMEPAGPPRAWLQPTLDALAAGGLDAPSLLANLQGVRGAAPWLADALLDRDADADADALAVLADAISATDGVLPIALATPLDIGWEIGAPVVASHLAIVREPDALVQVHARIAALTASLAPSAVCTLLLAPPWSDDPGWTTLLTGVDPATIANLTLRVPGVAPIQVDLGGVTAPDWLVVDLADDGDGPRADALAVLERVLDAVKRAQPGVQVVLVAHSYLGLVAEACAVARPTDVAGLVTLAAPLGTGIEWRLDDPVVADALRLCLAVAPGGVGGALGEALALAQARLVGAAAPGSSAAAPLPAAWQRSGAPAVALAGVPALCIAGCIEDDLVDALGAAVASEIAALAAAPTPTHLSWGVRHGLALPAPQAGDVRADVDIGLRLGSLALQAGAVLPPGGLAVRARVSQPGQWLVGGAGDGSALAGSVRWAALRAQVACRAAGATATVSLHLHDASLRTTLLAAAGLADAPSAELLDLLVRTLDHALPAGGHLDTFLGALADIGLARRATGSTPAAVLADGLKALRDDAVTRLSATLPALFDRAGGWLGFVRDAGAAAGTGGPWRLAAAPLPFECVVETLPARITVRSTGAGWPVDVAAAFDVSGTVTLAQDQPAVHARIGSPDFAFGSAAPGAPWTLTGNWLDAPVVLWPAAPAATAAALAGSVPTLLVNVAATLLMEQHFQGRVRIASPSGLLRDPAGWLLKALGIGASGLPSAAPINAVLSSVQSLLSLAPPGPGGTLALPGGLAISASDVADPNGAELRLSVATTTPISIDPTGTTGATLDLALNLDLGAHGLVRPGGALTLHLPLPATAAWQSVDIHFAADASGVQARVTTGSGVDVTLLPSVSGLDTLVRGATEQLLPSLLDKLAGALDTRATRPAALDDALAVAAALGVCDPNAAIGAGFAARAQALASFVEDLAAGHLQAQAPAIASAATTLLQRMFGAPIAASANAGGLGLSLAGVLGGTVSLTADFSRNPIDVRLHAQGLALGAVATDVEVGYVSAGLVAAVDLQATIDTGFGLVLSPRVSAALSVGTAPSLAIDFRPIGTDAVIVPLAPQPRPPTLDELLVLAESWLIPLAGTALLRAAAPVLAQDLWGGANRTIADVLVATKLVARAGDGTLSMVGPLPAPPLILQGVLDGLANIAVPLPGDLSIEIVKDSNLYGLVLGGEVGFDLGDYRLALRLGLPAALDPGWGGRGAGVGVLLLDLTNAASPKLAPVLRLGGLGVRFGRSQAGDALVEAGGFRLGAAAGYVSADLALLGPGAPKLSGDMLGAIELDGLGLTLGAGGNSGNPVAASLVKPDDSGDATPANPPFDLLVATSPHGPVIRFGGQPQLRIDIDKQFGPLYLEDIGLIYDPQTSGLGRLGIGLDATVALAGLEVDVQGLSLFVPLDHPSELDRWSLDLSGLAVSYSGSDVSISGGLLKAQLATTIEYRGALSVEIAAYGLSALGAYARPSDALGGYTSLFIFLAVSAPLGGPPYLFITGVAAGAGLNRRLLTPRDPALVPTFPLVQAMTGGGGSDPIEELTLIGTDIPPERGAFWLAAGVRFTTFELLQTTALLTVAIDRGFEVTLLGLMQLELPPTEDAMIVSLELALAAKYSTVDQVLSVRAALTQNSWLLSRDCQLTGGFAFVVWFARPEVLLTVGGYSTKFNVPDYYPDVPRVGFHWNVGSGIVVKGENFFAITHSAAMVGGALEASFSVAPISAWFSAELDAIIWWDPLRYQADSHIEVGVEILVEGCCCGVCVSLPPLRFTQGAWLSLQGPPLAGSVLVDVGVAKFTVPFGHSAPPPNLTWEQARDKYLCGGVPNTPATAASVAAGGLSTQTPPDGSLGSPWHVALEFALRVESKMPLSAWSLGSGTAQSPAFAPPQVDVVPAGPNVGPVRGEMSVVLQRRSGTNWIALDAATLAALLPTPVAGHFPGAVWDGGIKTHDADGKDTVDLTRPMLGAMASVELRNTIALAEATGQLTDLPLATLVEEEPTRTLSFGAAGGTPVAPLHVAVRRAPARARAVVAAAAEPGVRLQAQLDATRKAPVHAAAGALAHAAPRKGHALAAGGAQLWRVPAAQSHTVAVSGAARRVTGLSGSGAVLSDTLSAGADHALPMGVRTVLVTDAHDDAVHGWELATRVLQAEACVLVAPGATVLLARPWAPPARPGGQGLPRWLDASALGAAGDGGDAITTRFDIAGGAAPNTVLIRLDRRVAGARLASVVIDVAGGRIAERTEIRHGARVEMLCRVAADTRATALSISVRPGAGWRLAGVLGARGTFARWQREIEAGPHVRLASPAPAVAATRTAHVKVTAHAAAAAARRPR